MRGQSVLLSHTLVFGLSLILIIAVVAAMKNVADANKEFVGTIEIKQVCSLIKSASEKMTLKQDYTSPTSSLGGRITVSLPERIADLNYRATASGKDVLIQTRGAVNETCISGLDVTYSGSAAGGRALFELIRHASGTKEIRISNA